MLVLVTMQKLAASSVAAVRHALQKRLDLIRGRRVMQDEAEARLGRLRDLEAAGYADLQDEISALEEEVAADLELALVEHEEPWLERLLDLADAAGSETKVARIVELIRERFAGEPVLLFT